MAREDDRAWAQYSKDYRERVLPKLLDSGVFLSIHSEGDVELRQATDLGFALLMDKPILLIVPKGRTLPERLRRVADEVIDDWDGDELESQARMVAAIDRLMPKEQSDQ